MAPSRGIIYVAAGDAYVAEAQQSARQLREVMPSLPITLFADVDGPLAPFDEVRALPTQDESSTAKLVKVMCMAKSPYKHTLFLDSDVHVCIDITDVFDLLDAFDLAIAHAPNRLYFEHGDFPSTLPEAFPELNTGVMAYRRDEPAVASLFDTWERTYSRMLEDKNVQRDQISFRESIYDSTVRFTVLPPEYNYRFPFPAYLDGPARVLHGRHPNLDDVARYVNRSTERRVVEPWMFEPSRTERLKRFISSSLRTLKSLISR